MGLLVQWEANGKTGYSGFNDHMPTFPTASPILRLCRFIFSILYGNNQCFLFGFQTFRF